MLRWDTWILKMGSLLCTQHTILWDFSFGRECGLGFRLKQSTVFMEHIFWVNWNKLILKLVRIIWMLNWMKLTKITNIYHFVEESFQWIFWIICYMLHPLPLLQVEIFFSHSKPNALWLFWFCYHWSKNDVPLKYIMQLIKWCFQPPVINTLILYQSTKCCPEHLFEFGLRWIKLTLVFIDHADHWLSIAN